MRSSAVAFSAAMLLMCLTISGCATARSGGAASSCGEEWRPCLITLADLVDDSDPFAGQFVILDARIYNTGVHGMFLTDVDDRSVGIPLSVVTDVTSIPRFTDLLRLLAADDALKSSVVGTVKGIERYGRDGSRVFELREILDLKLDSDNRAARALPEEP